MAKPKYNVVQGKDIPGRDKPYWFKVGAGFEKDGKISIKLDALPLPNKEGDIWLKLFEYDDKRDEGFKPSGYDEAPWNG